MIEENNTSESPYPGPAEPGSEEDVYPDTEGAHNPEQAEDDIEPPEDGAVDDAEEPSPGNSI